MLYLIAGMNRSGSTWLFNVVRLLLKQTGAPDLAAGWVDDRDSLLQHQTPVIKVHIYDPALLIEPCCVLTSHRDPRDVAASLSRMFGLPATLAHTRYVFKQYAAWARHACYDMRYENMIADQPAEVLRIAAGIGIDISDVLARRITVEIREITASAKPGQEGFDPVSLLHAGHITDGRSGSWRKNISAELAQQVTAEFSAWMSEHGYLAPASSAPLDSD